MPKEQNIEQPELFRLDREGHLIPSRYAIIGYLQNNPGWQSVQAILKHYDLALDSTLFDALERRLITLTKLEVLRTNKNGEVRLQAPVIVSGRVEKHPKGFGFLVPDGKKSIKGEDLYLGRRQMRRVLPGDRVLVAVLAETKTKKRHKDAKAVRTDKRPKTRIVELLSPKSRKLIGKVTREGHGWFFTAKGDDLEPFAVDPLASRPAVKDFSTLSEATVVIAEIIQHPIDAGYAKVKLIEILGLETEADMPVRMAIFQHDIPHEWPAHVDQQINAQAERWTQDSVVVDDTRQDLSELAFVTIDGADARDFDDAVYCRDEGANWRLYVAIADVSAYVDTDSALDQEAQHRGNSVYFPNHVIPMLPKALSNGICSLNPSVDRNSMVCEIEIDKKGERQHYTFYPAVICSQARLTYSQAFELFDPEAQTIRSSWGHVIENIDALYHLYKVLYQKRNQRGAINFSFPEAEVHYNADKRIDRISIKTRNEAHQLIEECMLMANVCAAEFLHQKLNDRSIYRDHPRPDADSILTLRENLFRLGVSFKGGDQPKAKHYSQVIDQLADKPELVQYVQTLLLRSMSQAEYSNETEGHFALSYPLYTHFTSPIRRYTDLIVHRQIKAVLNKQKLHWSSTKVAELAAHCSMTERRADSATREVINWLKADFMCDKLHEEFDATITGVTDFGLFVMLNDLFVEGMIHISSLNDQYLQFQSETLSLINGQTGQGYRLGDPIRVQLIAVDMSTTRIDFIKVDD